jgi:hypothetical protein
MTAWELGLPGLTSSATAPAVGTTRCRSSKRFAPTSTFNDVTPVTFPFGRLRLATSPEATGSAPVSNTIGIVAVAPLAARAALMPPGAANTFTPRCASSAAMAGRRSSLPSAQR